MAHVASTLLSLLQQHVRPGGGGGAAGGGSVDGGAAQQQQQHHLLPARLLQLRRHGLALPSLTPSSVTGGGGGGDGHQVSELVASMPFELRALEVVLEQVRQRLPYLKAGSRL